MSPTVIGALIGAGSAVIVALAGIWANVRNTSATTEVSRRAVEAAQRTVELTERGQVTERYTKAIVQLGSDKLDVRIGAIYALERVARDSPTDHSTVMEVLTAFIRERSHEPWPPLAPDGKERPRRTRPDRPGVFIPDDPNQPESPAAPPILNKKGWTRPDVQAAATVVGRRDKQRDVFGERIDLIDASLVGVDLIAAGLSDADLNGADLAGANLQGADLRGADLTVADLRWATLLSTKLDSACLVNADLRQALLLGATFDDADLSGALWPNPAWVPEGWKRSVSGRLEPDT